MLEKFLSDIFLPVFSNFHLGFIYYLGPTIGACVEAVLLFIFAIFALAVISVTFPNDRGY